MIHHRTTAFVPSLDSRRKNYRRYADISKQFRYVVRMAHACHAAGALYDVAWKIADTHGMAATIEIMADTIPAAKPLPKDPTLRLVAEWKPKFHEAVYRLDAIANEKGRAPAFVIEHSSGLSLVCPTTTGEWGADCNDNGDADPNGKNWRLTHRASGRSFGLSGKLQTMAKALLLAASAPVDWTLGFETLKGQNEVAAMLRRILAEYGNARQRERYRVAA